jgi:hypothetical protein
MARYREGTGTGLAVAIASTAAFTLVAWLFAFLFWLAFSIYAIVEWIGDGEPSAIALSLIVAGLVVGLVVLAYVGIWLVGKSFAPAKRSPDETVGFTTIRKTIPATGSIVSKPRIVVRRAASA